MNSADQAKEILAVAIAQVYRGRMTTTSGGNFSLRDAENPAGLWITPSGVDKGSLQPKDMVRVLADGSTESEAGHRASSEFPIHRSIYEKRPELKAIIHAHPPALVAFALARKAPDLSVIPQIQKLCGSVGYADYRLPGSEVLGEVIAEEFERGANLVIMENHGVVVAGESMSEALQRLTAVEFTAKALLDSYRLGSPRPVENLDGTEVETEWGDPISEADPALVVAVEDSKAEVAALVQRACRQGLMPLTYGSISRRVMTGESSDFVITPQNMLRPGVQGNQLVWMRDGQRIVAAHETQCGVPDDHWRLHEAIYQNHPEVDSIIMTQAPALMAHAVAREPLDVTTNPESWVFVREVIQLPYGAQNDPEQVVKELSVDRPAILIDNEALVVTGGPLMQTFDRLEVCEFTAQSILLARSIGGAVEMEPEKIVELIEAFC